MAIPGLAILQIATSNQALSVTAPTWVLPLSRGKGGRDMSFCALLPYECAAGQGVLAIQGMAAVSLCFRAWSRGRDGEFA